MKRLVFILLCFLGFIQINAQEVDKSEPLKFLALGDSYTIGESVAEVERWPNQLFDSLKLKGVNGPNPIIIATTGWRTDQLKTAILNSGLHDTFNLVSVLIGVNNQYQGRPIGQYLQELPVLFNLAIEKAGGDTSKVFVVSIPDYAFTPFGQSANPQKISSELDVYNNINDSIAAEFSLSYYNITPISREGINEPALVAGDGLHPSGKQYSRWVNLILKGITFSNQTSPITSIVEMVKQTLNPFEVKGNQIVLNPKSEIKSVDSLMVFSLNGKMVFEKYNVSKSEFPLDLSTLPSGNYFLITNVTAAIKFFKP